MAQKRLLDGVASLLTDVTGAAQGVRREVETAVKGQVERFLRDMDIPTREELEVQRDMIAAMRAENERLAARVSALEGNGPPAAATRPSGMDPTGSAA